MSVSVQPSRSSAFRIGAGFRGVDRGGRPGHGVVDQIAEIVGEAWKQADFGGHDISSSIELATERALSATYIPEIWR